MSDIGQKLEQVGGIDIQLFEPLLERLYIAENDN